MDIFSKEKRRKIMQAIKSKGTGPEKRLEAALRAAGAEGLELQAEDLPGRPDFAHRRSRIAIFVEGCFFHGCPKHYRRPKTNTWFWDRKLMANRLRDRRNRRRLHALGWGVIRVWECATRGARLESAARTIAEVARAS